MAEPYDSQLAQAQNAGKPNPLDFRKARVIAGLEDGTAFSNGVAVVVLSPITGALAVRIRFMATGGGTLSFAYRRNAPNVDVAYDTDNAPPSADVPVTADTEAIADISPVGEAYLAITYTPSADGVVTYADIMQQ